jgi:hypothetical protein
MKVIEWQMLRAERYVDAKVLKYGGSQLKRKVYAHGMAIQV